MLFHMNTPIRLCFGMVLYDAPVQFLNTSLGGFCFGTVFYDASTQKRCEAPVRYRNKMHCMGVDGVHDVWCANVFFVPVLSLVKHTTN